MLTGTLCIIIFLCNVHTNHVQRKTNPEREAVWTWSITWMTLRCPDYCHDMKALPVPFCFSEMLFWAPESIYSIFLVCLANLASFSDTPLLCSSSTKFIVECSCLMRCKLLCAIFCLIAFSSVSNLRDALYQNAGMCESEKRSEGVRMKPVTCLAG